jgi:hypothetical protein
MNDVYKNTLAAMFAFLFIMLVVAFPFFLIAQIALAILFFANRIGVIAGLPFLVFGVLLGITLLGMEIVNR